MPHRRRTAQGTSFSVADITATSVCQGRSKKPARERRESGIPIGVALVDGEGRLVATGRNRRIQDRAVVMHAEINCLYNAGKDVEDFRGMTIYSTLMPCNMCAGAIVQFGITRVVVAESENFPERNGLELLQRHGVEVVDLDQGEAKEILREFTLRSPEVWSRDIGR